MRPANAPRPPSWSAAREVAPRDRDDGSEAAEDPRRRREQDREEEDGPREPRRVQARESRGTQREKGREARPADQQAERGAEPREHEALGDELAGDAAAARAESGAQADLPFAPRRPHEEQGRDVRAGDEDHETDAGEEREQRRTDVPHRVGMERDDPQLEARRRVLGELRPEPSRDLLELRLRARRRGSRREAGDHADPAHVARVLGEVAAERREDLDSGRHARVSREDDVEARRHDADDRHEAAVDADGLPDDRGVRSEAPPPEGVGQHHGPVAGRAFVRGQQGAPELRRHAEDRQEVRGRQRETHPLRLALAGDRARADPDARHLRKLPAAPADLQELVRGRRARAAGATARKSVQSMTRRDGSR